MKATHSSRKCNVLVSMNHTGGAAAGAMVTIAIWRGGAACTSRSDLRISQFATTSTAATTAITMRKHAMTVRGKRSKIHKFESGKPLLRGGGGVDIREDSGSLDDSRPGTCVHYDLNRVCPRADFAGPGRDSLLDDFPFISDAERT